ncbi:MAG TPA: cytochrome c-type biogenesis protein [Marinospirillum sp.]|uniref:cytochrome c-type biogenesis protein n=1 Tax=Marinospirillum sp. TaxID=2183934 RepID=UPI002B47BE02|nr:cytochrome c-type biogenesis protein [Marinospirillum sp.]HKM16406.1 cytochrome c-type biogenesis protein [Marinospirillum sp.]
MASKALIFYRTLSLFMFVLLVLFASSSYAAIELYDFTDDSYQARYKDVGGKLRCPKCENQSIADSNSPSAYDMRQELYRLLEEGKTDSQIYDFMVSRFGDYVLYEPPMRKDTWLLWYLPPALVVLGLLLAFFLVRSRSSAKPAITLSASERQARIQQILELEKESS